MTFDGQTYKQTCGRTSYHHNSSAELKCQQTTKKCQPCKECISVVMSKRLNLGNPFLQSLKYLIPITTELEGYDSFSSNIINAFFLYLQVSAWSSNGYQETLCFNEETMRGREKQKIKEKRYKEEKTYRNKDDR